jgi:hypothetical protein
MKDKGSRILEYVGNKKFMQNFGRNTSSEEVT